MKTFWTVLKTSLNTYYGFSAMRFKWLRQKKGLWEPLLILFGIVVGFGSMLRGYWAYLDLVYSSLRPMGQQAAVLTQGFVAGAMLTLSFGIVWVIAALYFANDISILAPLPISGGTILTAKFVTILTTEYVTLLLATAPPLVLYGLRSDVGIAYWLLALLTFLLTPVIPLVLASLFAVLLMRFVAPKKSRDLLTIIGGLFGLVVYVAIQFIQRQAMMGQKPEELIRLLTASNGVVQQTGRIFPPSVWATLALADPLGVQGLPALALLVGWTVLLLAILYFLADRFFLPAIMSGSEVTAKKKELSTREVERLTEDRGPISALFQKEFKLLNRNPTWLMNVMLATFLVPIAMVMPFISGPAGGEITKLLAVPHASDYITLATAGLMAFGVTLQSVAVTAFSREGRQFWIIRSLPLSFPQIIRAKAYHAFLLALVSAIPSLLIATLLFHLPPVQLLLAFVLGAVSFLPFIAFGLLTDLFRPYLDWNQPQQVIKKNVTVILYTFLSLPLIGLMVVLTVYLMSKGFGFAAVYLILMALMLAIAALFAWLLMGFGEKMYGKIEV